MLKKYLTIRVFTLSKFFFYSVCCVLLISPNFGCKDKEFINNQENVSDTRIIAFAGYEWEVRTSNEKKAGPGPNYFSNSEENVWVDDDGQLHLRIVKRSGKWYCAGVTLLGSPGYGAYSFQTETNFHNLDKNAVTGLFLYRSDDKEIDIELSKWGEENNQIAQYVVQPFEKAGNKERFDLPPQELPLTHIIDWHADSLVFSSYMGEIGEQQTKENQIKKWRYPGFDNPRNFDDLATKINFWLFRGMAPSGTDTMEIVISNFRYTR